MSHVSDAVNWVLLHPRVLLLIPAGLACFVGYAAYATVTLDLAIDPAANERGLRIATLNSDTWPDVARHRRATPDLLGRLYRRGSLAVRASVAANPVTSGEVLELAMSDPSTSVRISLLRNPTTTSVQVDRLIREDPDDVAVLIVDDPRVSPELLAEILAGWTERPSADSGSSDPSVVQGGSSLSHNVRLRNRAIDNPNVTVDQLDAAMRHIVASVMMNMRPNVIGHPALQSVSRWVGAGWLPKAAVAAAATGRSETVVPPGSFESLALLAEIGLSPEDAFWE